MCAERGRIGAGNWGWVFSVLTVYGGIQNRFHNSTSNYVQISHPFQNKIGKGIGGKNSVKLNKYFV